MIPLRETDRLKAESIAEDILKLSRSSLAVNFRFLDRAISRLPFICDENGSLCTDGEKIYFGPWYILRRYKGEPSVITRDLFHTILHCVFCHSFIGQEIDRLRWDLACDITVENALSEFNVPVLNAKREAEQSAMLSLLKAELGVITAERVYKWLGDRGFGEDELDAERVKFIADGHGIWYGGTDRDAKPDKDIELKKIWEDVSKRMQTELETMNNDKDSALVQNLRSLNRARYSYSEFLRHFMISGEVMRLSDEEFDNNYYTYGLELYGNIPLIEPLEYSEQRRIRELVIAIDTSGSVKGNVVQSFMQHTHDILSRQENFFSKVNIRILQCDDRIRDDARITCREDFDEYIKTLEIRGLGRTDFRPVFRYVDELIRKRELVNLQGLLYFTDGDGPFPQQKPDYETAFILNRSGFSEPEIPVWAMHISLTEDEILDERLSAC